MNTYLNDKVIDDQGNVKTIAGGPDARLYYIDFEGNRKKYLLDGEAAGGAGSGDKISGYVGNADLKFTDGTGYLNADEQTKKLKIGSATDSNTPNLEDVDIYGEFVKTHGEGLIVYGPEQELLSVLDDELKYKGDFEIQRLKRQSISYFDFASHTFFTCDTGLTEITFNLPAGTLENAVLQFTTGNTIEFEITGSTAYKINKPFDFAANKTYIILVDAYDIFWCELQSFNQ